MDPLKTLTKDQFLSAHKDSQRSYASQLARKGVTSPAFTVCSQCRRNHEICSPDPVSFKCARCKLRNVHCPWLIDLQRRHVLQATNISFQYYNHLLLRHTSVDPLTGIRYQQDMPAFIIQYYRSAWMRSYPTHPLHNLAPEPHPKDPVLFSKPMVPPTLNHAANPNPASSQNPTTQSLNPVPSKRPGPLQPPLEVPDRGGSPQNRPPPFKRLRLLPPLPHPIPMMSVRHRPKFIGPPQPTLPPGDALTHLNVTTHASHSPSPSSTRLALLSLPYSMQSPAPVPAHPTRRPTPPHEWCDGVLMPRIKPRHSASRVHSQTDTSDSTTSHATSATRFLPSPSRPLSPPPISPPRSVHDHHNPLSSILSTVNTEINKLRSLIHQEEFFSLSDIQADTTRITEETVFVEAQLRDLEAPDRATRALSALHDIATSSLTKMLGSLHIAIRVSHNPEAMNTFVHTYLGASTELSTRLDSFLSESGDLVSFD